MIFKIHDFNFLSDLNVMQKYFPDRPGAISYVANTINIVSIAINYSQKPYFLTLYMF
jgi:hypothetical protein